jgi:hypothetical protein
MSNLDADIAHRIKAKGKPEAIAPGIEDKCLELKGVGELLGHLGDTGNDFGSTFFFLGNQVERLADEIVDLDIAARKKSKKSDPDFGGFACERCRQLGQRHAMAEVRLREVFLAWKAFHDLGEDSDSPLGAPLWARASAAEDKIRDLKSDEPEVGIAKLITSRTADMAKNIGSTCDEAMAADAALAGLRWFGLEDLYYECFPADAAQIKKALLEAEATS